ncbi:hypothetical protein EV682_11941 [Iodobacter fluviatilis]|uniref:Uncharacterized protein n=1 Tax=Iodobacter fluviatilis TaxID=537 RepID=A0A377QDD8_9NEIS|nr:hypothetical protein EV682_11941 [Iodobacter fluviatilis]STQ91891.1 Uncharacterised protein [Iodobacter fluviatilis]
MHSKLIRFFLISSFACIPLSILIAYIFGNSGHGGSGGWGSLFPATICSAILLAPLLLAVSISLRLHKKNTEDQKHTYAKLMLLLAVISLLLALFSLDLIFSIIFSNYKSITDLLF